MQDYNIKFFHMQFN